MPNTYVEKKNFQFVKQFIMVIVIQKRLWCGHYSRPSLNSL